MKRIDPSTLDLKDKVVTINRVTKVVKGGRTMRFSALVVVGDGNGHVGCGVGKAAEIPDAIRKGKEDAMKNIIEVNRNDVDSIFHGVTACCRRYRYHRWWPCSCRIGIGRYPQHQNKIPGFQQQT